MKIPWISEIETRDDALTVLNHGTIAFFFLGALHIFPYLSRQSPVALVETTVVIVGALALRQLHSRGVAVLLVAVACADTISAVANVFGASFARGSSFVLAGLMMWVAVRTTQAVAALQRMPDEDEDEDGEPGFER